MWQLTHSPQNGSISFEHVALSPHSTTPPPKFSPTSSRGCRRVGRLPRSACRPEQLQEIARVRRFGEEPREGVGVGVDVVECGLYCVCVAVCEWNKAGGVEWSMTPVNTVALASCPHSLAGACAKLPIYTIVLPVKLYQQILFDPSHL